MTVVTEATPMTMPMVVSMALTLLLQIWPTASQTLRQSRRRKTTGNRTRRITAAPPSAGGGRTVRVRRGPGEGVLARPVPEAPRPARWAGPSRCGRL